MVTDVKKVEGEHGSRQISRPDFQQLASVQLGSGPRPVSTLLRVRAIILLLSAVILNYCGKSRTMFNTYHKHNVCCELEWKYRKFVAS